MGQQSNSVIAWCNASNQQVLVTKIMSQNASITGLTSYGDQIISIESHSDRLSFYDLRRPDALIYVCSLERDFYDFFPEIQAQQSVNDNCSSTSNNSKSQNMRKQGNSSIHLTGNLLTINSLGNEVI